MITRLILVGMSGSGKSTVGEIVARRLGWKFADMDDLIEAEQGRTIPDIFAQEGEAYFREQEAIFLDKSLRDTNLVLSTGGGATCNEQAQERIRESSGTLSVWLHADADELWQRVHGHEDESRTTARPMLDGDDPLAKMKSLISEREKYYSAADVTVPVGNRSADLVAANLHELVELANGVPSTVHLDTGKAQSNISVGVGVADTLPTVVAEQWPDAQAVWLGVDTNVAAHHANWLKQLEAKLAIPLYIYEIASGESSKALATYSKLLDWMLEGGAQRGDVAIALGGGVVGDLMGFAAATVLRGIGLVQIPTTLLSMVDSSVGGKTGINHTAGKNLIGAFYQPPVVLVDPRFLQTVPERELRSGFAEVIKHGVIQASVPNEEPGFLTEVLRKNTDGLLSLQQPLTSWVLRRNIQLKAHVVAEDEFEGHLRKILNFGHTIGHGIEAAGYQLLHGEAVAVGIVAASEIAVQRGDVTREWVDDLRQLIQSYGLPVTARASHDEVLDKMRADKKKSAGKQNWVLPTDNNGVKITDNIGEKMINIALESVLAGL